MDERHQILAAATKTGRQGVNVSTILVALSLASLAREAAAQDFSHDGYTPDGAYQLNVEVDPFGFLPHAAASASGLGPRGRAGLSGSIGPWQIVESLKGALFATGRALRPLFSGAAHRWGGSESGQEHRAPQARNMCASNPKTPS